jgi:hypothetical protein
LLCLILGPNTSPAATRLLTQLGSHARKGVWFNHVKTKIALSDADAGAVFGLIRQALSRDQTTAPPLPNSLQKDRAPRVVFLSASDGKNPARVAIGAGKGFGPALQDALARLKKWTGKRPPRWFKLDVVQEVERPAQVDKKTVLSFDPSLQGIAFERRFGIALLPEQLVARMLVSPEYKLRIGSVNDYWKQLGGEGTPAPLAPKAGPWKVRFFTATSLFNDGRETVRLYRGHHFPRQVAREQVLQAARAGGEYLRRAVDKDGSFAYIYYPKTNTVTDSYNIVRHAGTVYAMFEVYGATRDPELLKATQRANQYLLGLIKPYQKRKDTACLVENGKIKLGAVALALVALAKEIEVTRKKTNLGVARRLARYILLAQQPSGRFISERAFRGGKPLTFDSAYYPGEAILGLLRLYAQDRNKAWLDAADRGAQWLIEVRDRGTTTAKLNQDHWLLYGLNELYRFRKRPIYLTHTLRICEAIGGSQNRRPSQPDYLGSYNDPPRSTPAATRAEGMMAAYRLVRDFGTKKQAQSIRDTIYLTVAFQLQTHFGPESVLYLDDPVRTLGGVHESLTNFSIRIDYVQHSLSGLLAIYRMLKADGRELFAPAKSKPAKLVAKMRRRALRP